MYPSDNVDNEYMHVDTIHPCSHMQQKVVVGVVVVMQKRTNDVVVVVVVVGGFIPFFCF